MFDVPTQADGFTYNQALANTIYQGMGLAADFDTTPLGTLSNSFRLLSRQPVDTSTTAVLKMITRNDTWNVYTSAKGEVSNVGLDGLTRVKAETAVLYDDSSPKVYKLELRGKQYYLAYYGNEGQQKAISAPDLWVDLDSILRDMFAKSTSPVSILHISRAGFPRRIFNPLGVNEKPLYTIPILIYTEGLGIAMLMGIQLEQIFL